MLDSASKNKVKNHRELFCIILNVLFKSKISFKRYEFGENEVVRRVRTVGSYLLPNMAFWNNAHTLKVERLERNH